MQEPCFSFWQRSALSLLGKVDPRPSRVGIVLLILAAVLMPWLANQKRRLSEATGSAALRADAAESAVCGYLALIAMTLPGSVPAEMGDLDSNICHLHKRQQSLGESPRVPDNDLQLASSRVHSQHRLVVRKLMTKTVKASVLVFLLWVGLFTLSYASWRVVKARVLRAQIAHH